MALDLHEGDIFVMDGEEYPIRACAEWSYRYGRSMMRLATETASTKRAPAIAGGKRGAAATNLTELSCTPLDPVDAELRQRLGLNTPHELLQTFVDGGTTFYHLVVEELKR